MLLEQEPGEGHHDVSGGGMDLNSLVERLKRLAMLDTSVFDEVRTDQAATIPAVVVAVASFFLFALGGWFWWLFTDFGGSGKLFWQSVDLGSIFAIILWGVWVAITYVLLTQVFHARVDVNELVRVMAFATVPLAHRVADVHSGARLRHRARRPSR